MLLQFLFIFLLQHPIGNILAAPIVNTCPGTSTLESGQIDGHDQRTIPNIIWSCVTTILACTWVAVHPNMAKPGANHWDFLKNRLRIMIWMMIAPELVIFWAIRQWLGARNMKLKYSEKYKHWGMTHGYFIQMGGFMLYEKKGETWKKKGVLTEARLDELLANEQVEFPTITKEEIQDRSKRDALSKIVAIGQTIWFVAQSCTRKAQELDTTELELITVAFAALNTFVYYFWWSKPMDVQTTVPVYELGDGRPRPRHQATAIISRSNSLAEPQTPHKAEIATAHTGTPRWSMFSALTPVYMVIKFVKKSTKLPRKAFIGLFRRLGNMCGIFNTLREDEQQVPRFYAKDCTPSQQKYITASVSAIGVIFGAVHCIAWSFTFPTNTERSIWKVSSVIITCVPLVMACCTFVVAFARTDNKNNLMGRWVVVIVAIIRFLGVLVGIFGIFPYIIARLLLLVEAFASLRDLPPSALLEVRWTSFLPHL